MVSTIVSPEAEKVVSSAVTTRIVLVLEYNGTHYHGFQLQAVLPTIQGEVEKAIRRLTGEKTHVATASRTDTGVHAKGQVVSFKTGSYHSPETFVKALNYYLPRDIAVKAAHGVRESFNVRRQAISREYNYYILNSSTRSPLRRLFSYQVAGHLDLDAMNQACQVLVGEHDFVSFASDIGVEVKSTVRRVHRAEVKKEGELIIFNIIANSFLPHQVRNTVGALVRVGQGRMSLAEFRRVMEAKEPGLAGPAAPGCGLCLMQVNYKRPFEEEYDENLQS